MVDYAALLSVDADEVKRPPALPPGTYDVVITRDGQGATLPYEFGETKNKNTPYCRVFVKVLGPTADVDPALAAEIKFPKEIRRDFFLTPDAMFMLKEFLEACSIDMTGRKLNDCLPEVAGKQLQAIVTSRPDPASGVVYNDIRKFVKV